MEAAVDAVGIERDLVAGGPRTRGLGDVIVEGWRRVPDGVERAAISKERVEVPGGGRERIGDDNTRAGTDPPGRIVVGPLPGDVKRALGEPGLGVAARVAEVAEDDRRPGRESDISTEIHLAEVLVDLVVDPGNRIQSEAILGRGGESVPIWAGPTVAVAEVHDDGCSL